jgi:hypothetical protein
MAGGGISSWSGEERCCVLRPAVLQAAAAEVNGLGVRDETTSSDPILLLWAGRKGQGVSAADLFAEEKAEC